MYSLVDLLVNGDIYKGNFSSANDYFKKISEKLIKDKFVKENFFYELVKRENQFPTGIETLTYCVAMPHVESQFVLSNALFITVFDQPISFQRMDDVDKSIPVKISFLLLIQDTSSHMKAISELVSLFSDQSVLEALVRSANKEFVIDIIREKIKHD